MGNKPEISTCCTCGYKWKTGISGDHSCVEYLLDKLKRLERDWQTEHRIIELLIVGGFVTSEKVEQARDLLAGMP